MVFWSVDWQGLIKLTLKLRHYSALVPRSWTLGQSPRRGGAGKGEGELYALHPSLRPLFWSPSDRYWEWLQCYDWGVFAIFLNYHEVLRYPLLNFDCTRSVRGKNLIATPIGCFFNTFFWQSMNIYSRRQTTLNTNCRILLTYHQILKTTVYKECIRINNYKWFFSVIFNWLIEWIFFFTWCWAKESNHVACDPGESLRRFPEL